MQRLQWRIFVLKKRFSYSLKNLLTRLLCFRCRFCTAYEFRYGLARCARWDDCRIDKIDYFVRPSIFRCNGVGVNIP